MIYTNLNPRACALGVENGVTYDKHTHITHIHREKKRESYVKYIMYVKYIIIEIFEQFLNNLIMSICKCGKCYAR